MLMPTIEHYMSRQPWTIRRDASLAEAREMMRAHQLRHLPVLDAGVLVGIVSERDIYQLERFRYLDRHLTVEDAMTEDVYTADAEDPVDRVVGRMAEDKLGSTVVVNQRGKLAGVFTTVDAMRVLAEVLRRAAA